MAAKGGLRYTRGEAADAVRQLLLQWDDSFPSRAAVSRGHRCTSHLSAVTARRVLWDDSGSRSRLSYGEATSFVLQVDPRVLRSLPHPSEYYKSSLRAGTPVNNKTNA